MFVPTGQMNLRCKAGGLEIWNNEGYLLGFEEVIVECIHIDIESD